MTGGSSFRAGQYDGLRRVRLSEWARQEGIAGITAYRMLQRGILPVPSERSPTGRWYVLLPAKPTGRIALYTRATPGPHQAQDINNQIAVLSEWASSQRQPVFTVVKEFADPFLDAMPKLAKLLSDRQVGHIVVESLDVIGESRYSLLVAALAPQGRSIIALNNRAKNIPHGEAHAAIVSLCKRMYGSRDGIEAARRVLEFQTGH